MLEKGLHINQHHGWGVLGNVIKLGQVVELRLCGHPCGQGLDVFHKLDLLHYAIPHHLVVEDDGWGVPSHVSGCYP